MRIALVLLATVLLAAPVSRGEETQQTPEVQLLSARAPTIVSIKLVMNIEIEIQGQQIKREENAAVTGVIVDASGLVMLGNSVLDPNNDPRMAQFRQFFGDIKIKSSPSNFRVVFPGNDKEYPAILGARDSKLGLAFLLIKDLEGHKPAVLDLGKVTEPTVGSTVYMVSRMDQGFDFAPICQTGRVIASLQKPRRMWAVDGLDEHLGQPIYTADGAVAGVMSMQKGVGDEGAAQACALPMEVVQARLKRAQKAAHEALQEVVKREAEEAAKEKEDAAGGNEDKGEDAEAKKDG